MFMQSHKNRMKYCNPTILKNLCIPYLCKIKIFDWECSFLLGKWKLLEFCPPGQSLEGISVSVRYENFSFLLLMYFEERIFVVL